MHSNFNHHALAGLPDEALRELRRIIQGELAKSDLDTMERQRLQAMLQHVNLALGGRRRTMAAALPAPSP